jgi:hypothetical protein
MPTSLARRYDAVIAVERGDGDPAMFVWRGRRHYVHEVLDHWWETGRWWERGRGAAPGSDDERELWRVEAGTAAGAAVIAELAFAWSSGVWTLRAVLD